MAHVYQFVAFHGQDNCATCNQWTLCHEFVRDDGLVCVFCKDCLSTERD